MGHDFDDQEVDIRVDQYIAVCFPEVERLHRPYLNADEAMASSMQKFTASVTRGIEHDFTMGV